jgi:N-acetylglutamate synthase-like GNAT family acetyltransferase
MSGSGDHINLGDRLTVRTYQPEDQPDVSRLFETGLLAGQVAANDTGADVEHIQDAYLSDERSHFWVAVVDGQVRGMIGVAEDEPHTAEVRRLRVDRDLQNSNIADRLLITAIDHCRHHGYLKVRLDTHFEPNEAVDMFDKLGFQHTRTRSVHDKELLEFYFDLYRQPKPDED